MHVEEGLDLGADVVVPPGLVPAHFLGVAVHGVAHPGHHLARLAHSLNQRRQLLAQLDRAHAHNDRQATGRVLGVERGDQRHQLRRVHLVADLAGGTGRVGGRGRRGAGRQVRAAGQGGRLVVPGQAPYPAPAPAPARRPPPATAHLDADGVANATQVLDVRVVQLPRALAAPQEVAAAAVPEAGGGVLARQRLLIVHQQALRAGRGAAGGRCRGRLCLPRRACGSRHAPGPGTRRWPITGPASTGPLHPPPAPHLVRHVELGLTHHRAVHVQAAGVHEGDGLVHAARQVHVSLALIRVL